MCEIYKIVCIFVIEEKNLAQNFTLKVKISLLTPFYIVY